MESAQKKAKRSEEPALDAASLRLLLCAVGARLHWSDSLSFTLSCTAAAAALRTPHVRRALALRNAAALPGDAVRWVESSGDPWKRFTESAVPLLKDRQALLRELEKVAPQWDVGQLDWQVVGAMRIRGTRGTSSVMAPVQLEVPLPFLEQWRAKGANVLPVVVLDLTAIQKSGPLSAFGWLPSSGKLYLFTEDWRDATLAYYSDGSEPTESYSFATVKSGEYLRSRGLDNSVKDRLFLECEWGWPEEVKKAVEQWEERRSKQPGVFRSGYYPPQDYVRLGGSQPFDGQGNFVIADDERIICQTSHPMGYNWAAFGFYIAQEDLDGGKWSEVKHDIVDDV